MLVSDFIGNAEFEKVYSSVWHFFQKQSGSGNIFALYLKTLHFRSSKMFVVLLSNRLLPSLEICRMFLTNIYIVKYKKIGHFIPMRTGKQLESKSFCL